MKLTVLTQYYLPEIGAPQNRLSDLAVRLTAWGHHVEVLTALPNYPGSAIHHEYVGRENTIESIAGVPVARVGLRPPRNGSFADRLRCYLSFASSARRYGASLMRPSDVLLMESPPLFIALAGVRLARQLGARLVTNISDLWPASAVALGMVRPGPALWAAQRLESWMYSQSASISGQTEGIVAEIRRRFPNKRVELYPNGVDLARFTPPLDRDGVRRAFGWSDDAFVVGYTGTLGHPQALDQVLDAVKQLDDLNGLHVALFGAGPRQRHLERRITVEGLHRVRMYGQQPRERIPHIQAALDVGLVPLARGPVFEGGRPSKMFEIMAAARPVLACARGEVERLIAGGQPGPTGMAVPPEDADALATAIRFLYSHRDDAVQMGQRGQDFVREHFDRERIARRMESFLVSVAAG